MLSDNLNSYYMKKLIVVAVSAGIFAYLNSGSRSDDLFPANVEALADNEGSYPCPGACLTWTGSNGGGMDCMCHRYVGRCKRWCD